MDLTNKRIVVTGGAGFLGSRIVQTLVYGGVNPANIFVPRSHYCDLRTREACQTITYGCDVLIHAAGNVGGIGLNREKPGELFYDNLMMGIQLMEAARLHGVAKFVTIGTICEYPKFTPVPFSESSLWDGYPEETNAPYGIAKKALLTQGQAYRQQYGMSVIHLLPVNLYGPGDNFKPDSSHVIPALIRKVAEAQAAKKNKLTVWGTGRATREFLYVHDAARAIVLATRRYDGPEPVNIGSGQEIPIYKLVKLICELMDFSGDIVWDESKPNGQPRRCLDVSQAKLAFGFTATTLFRDGLQRTIAWYRNRCAKS